MPTCMYNRLILTDSLYADLYVYRLILTDSLHADLYV